MSGDRRSPQDLAGLIVTWRTRLLGFIRKRIAPADDAEDVLQDVLSDLIRTETLMDPVENVGAWLFRSARNALIDRTRRKRDIPFSDLHTETDDDHGDDESLLADALFMTAETPEDAYLRSLIRAELAAAVADLPPAQRDVFVRVVLGGEPFRRIAEETGENINTLLARKRAATASLRKRLEAVYADLQAVNASAHR